MAQITVLDAKGAEQTIEAPSAPGRAAAASSRPVALSTEDKAALDAMASALEGAATEAHQDTANTLLAAIRDALSDDPTAAGLAAVVNALADNATGADIATIVAALDGTLTVDGSAVTQPISADALPLPNGAATSAKQDSVLTALAALLTEAEFEARIPTLGTKAASGSISTTPSTDQDPVFDHANAVRFAVTTASQAAITPPASCKYMRVHAEGDCFIRTDGTAAADAAGSIKLLANQPETIPVIGGTAVTVIGASATTLRATPMKVR